MLIVVSPAKSLDFESEAPTKEASEPRFLGQSSKLIKELRKLSVPQISKLMGLSEKLSTLNHDRYKDWKEKPKSSQIKQAVFAFQGDVYKGLQAETFNKSDLKRAQKQFRILSGLYGLLAPLDLIQPYRLEMGTKIQTKDHKNLYEFWDGRITDMILSDMKNSKTDVLVNLASNEYYKSVKPKMLAGKTVVTPVFKDCKNGVYKIVSFHAKRARGMMSSYIIRNAIKNPEGLLGFNIAGYRYSTEHTDDVLFPTFIRDEA